MTEHRLAVALVVVLLALTAGATVGGLATRAFDDARLEQRLRDEQLDTSRVIWRSQLDGCERARARTIRANATTAALRGFLLDAAAARRAAYRRDGFATDLRAARSYTARADRLGVSPLVDCAAAYPPPPGLETR